MTDGIYLYQRGKRVFAHELVGLFGFKLDMKGKWANINFNNNFKKTKFQL